MEKERAIDRLRKYMAVKDLNDSQVEKILGMSGGNMHRYSKPDTDISQKTLRKLVVKFPDINEDWLYFGKGEMLKDELVVTKGLKENCARDGMILPLVPLRFLGSFDTDNKEMECEQYDIPFFYKIGANFLVEVVGDSMMPKFQNGDIVACKKIEGKKCLQWGHVYVIDSTIGTIMKVVNKGLTDGVVLCHSLNENYADFELELTAIRSLAMVVGTMSSYV